MIMENKFILFFKGMLMGICDLIPGISGGTIAFITGIYERLINAVKGFSLELLSSLVSLDKKRINNNIKKLDLGFLFVLFSGIIFSILLGSRIIERLLENYYAKTISFFVGLILASSFIIYENISRHNFKNYVYCFIGFIIGIGLMFLRPAEVSISNGYLFFGGFFAISAMFLPGISGSFILLIMGLYEPIIDMLHDIIINIRYLVIFILGMVFGAFFISRLISYLFKKDKCKTLYFLLGLVLGTLGIPVVKIYEVASFSGNNIFMLPLLFFIGALLVLLVGRYVKN